MPARSQGGCLFFFFFFFKKKKKKKKKKERKQQIKGLEAEDRTILLPADAAGGVLGNGGGGELLGNGGEEKSLLAQVLVAGEVFVRQLEDHRAQYNNTDEVGDCHQTVEGVGDVPGKTQLHGGADGTAPFGENPNGPFPAMIDGGKKTADQVT